MASYDLASLVRIRLAGASFEPLAALGTPAVSERARQLLACEAEVARSASRADAELAGSPAELVPKRHRLRHKLALRHPLGELATTIPSLRTYTEALAARRPISSCGTTRTAHARASSGCSSYRASNEAALLAA